MSLLKLSPNNQVNFDPIQKAQSVINQIPSQNLIIEAYLFGSAVNGIFTPDSDLDFVLSCKTTDDIKKLQKEVYSANFSDIAIDWIFKLTEEFENRKNMGGVCFEAFHYGKKMK